MIGQICDFAPTTLANLVMSGSLAMQRRQFRMEDGSLKDMRERRFVFSRKPDEFLDSVHKDLRGGG
jgi:hypothetical protein